MGGDTAAVGRLWERILRRPIGSGWHWLAYNFTPGSDGARYFAPLTLEALVRADAAMPGYAESMVSRLEQIHGRERDMRDYNAILQWLAELIVVDHLVQYPWPREANF